MECRMEGKGTIFEMDNSPIVRERRGTDGETVGVIEEDGGEDMEDREVGVVGETDGFLQGEAEDTRRMAMRLSVGDSRNERDPEMILGGEKWGKEDVLYVDGWDT